jgi:hypothetical protein
MKTHGQILSLAIIVGTIAATGNVWAQQGGTVYGPSTPQTAVPAGGLQPRFVCEYVNGQYTVSYRPIDRPGQSYPWAVPGSMGGGWSASSRCSEISRRLEEYRKDGLKELRTEIKNRYDTVCVTTEKNSGCRIVFTVPPGKDPITTRDSVFRNLTMADSGQQTQGVYTFTDNGGDKVGDFLGKLGIPGLPSGIGGGSQNPASPTKKNMGGIDLRPFLSTTDGGTATQLRPVTQEKAPTGNTNKGKKHFLKSDRFR